MRVIQQGFDLMHATPFRNHDYTTQFFESIAIGNDRVCIQFFNGAPKDAFNKMIDVAACSINLERHFAAMFEPAAEHTVMSFLIGTMFFNFGDKCLIVGATRAGGFKNAV